MGQKPKTDLFLEGSSPKKTQTHCFSPENQLIKSCYLHTPLHTPTLFL